MIKFVNKAELVGEVGFVRTYGAGPTRCVKLTMNTQSNLKKINSDDCIILTWHNIVVWCNSVKNFEDVTLLQKGAAIRVLGRISSKKYVDKEGINRTLTEIIAHQVDILEQGSISEDTPDESEESVPMES